MTESTNPPTQPAKPPRWFWLIILIIPLATYFATEPQHNGELNLSAAKGVQLDLFGAGSFSKADGITRDILLNTTELRQAMSDRSVDFLTSAPLSTQTLRQWESADCSSTTCRYATLYDYANGGTVEAIVNIESQQVLDLWRNKSARPTASPYVLDKVVEIASQDEAITAVLGPVAESRFVMVPLAAWLEDDDCAQDWCIDLTFASPEDDGRITHVIVNMEQEKVARLFYTRGRTDRSYAPPIRQALYEDGCREQSGWNVCWEMTAHDGVNFYDATFNGSPVFASTKIGQVEAFYVSWPGGYRDEIGNASSVPPLGSTIVQEIDDGFQVTQMFSELFDWPNCVCCYRYEQTMKFFADGSFEMIFVSHGPGCDELASYRPFWRIDMDVNGKANDSAFIWQNNAWAAAATEFEGNLYADRSPNNERLLIANGDTVYRWQPIATDPLGLDDGRIFVIQNNEREGENPILSGPANTYEPPLQFINGEQANNNDLVVWYVPILDTKRGGPWWCMPDPEPEFSPCHSVMRVQRSNEIGGAPVVIEEPVAVVEAAPTDEPTSVEPTTAPVASDAPPTPRPIEGADAEEIILNAGCGACHVIGALGEKGKVGPDLSDIGNIAATRIEGVSAEEYLRQSIINPNSYIVAQCPNGSCVAGAMPLYGSRLTDTQVNTLVNYMLSLKNASITDIGAEPTAIPTTAVSNLQPIDPVANTEPTPTTAPASSTLPLVIGGLGALFLLIGAFLFMNSRKSEE